MNITDQARQAGIEPSLLTAQQVASLLAVSPDAVRRWTRSGLLRRVKLGRATRYRRADIESVIARGIAGPTRG